jgi:hypothetical protein
MSLLFLIYPHDVAEWPLDEWVRRATDPAWPPQPAKRLKLDDLPVVWRERGSQGRPQRQLTPVHKRRP